MTTAPVVLITGTSSGIGQASAIALAEAGYRVVATMRDLGRAAKLRAQAEAAGVTVDVRRLDVTDDESVDNCITGVVADYGRLDAVVNNAGAGHLGTAELDTLYAYRRVMEVNYFGVVRVTRAAMPHLRATQGRLVTITSIGGVVAQPFNEAYCAAKFAVEGMMESLAPVARAVGVRVSVIEPGPVASEFVTNVDVDRQALIANAGPYASLLAGYLQRTAAAFSSAQTSAEVGDFVRGVLTESDPAFRYQTSDLAAEVLGLKLADLDGAAVQKLTAAWLQ